MFWGRQTRRVNWLCVAAQYAWCPQGRSFSSDNSEIALSLGMVPSLLDEARLSANVRQKGFGASPASGACPAMLLESQEMSETQGKIEDVVLPFQEGAVRGDRS